LPTTCAADASYIPDRRKPQFETETGYAVLPFPYSLPGIGMGVSLLGGIANVAETYVDVYGGAFAGDITGGALGVDDIHLISKRLIMEVGASAINKASITSYSKRGMRTNKDDYTIIEIGDTGSLGTRLTASFYDRRFEFYGAYFRLQSRLERIRDNQGDIIIEIDDPSTETGDQEIAGLRFDFTDDYQDPRTGIRLDVSGWYNPKEGSGPAYLLLDFNTTAYVPVGNRSTWVFNYFHSDATIFQKGETDRVVVEDQMGLDCASITDVSDQQRCNELIDTVVANNTYGTASGLGGFSRLRSYSQGRYQGAHTRFVGTEFRWNLTEEFTPFDLYLIKDVRTAIQLSFFYELGAVADKSSDLGSVTRSSYGTGLRIVTASGMVFRGDAAFGREGFQPNVFIGYPWEI
jgi:outer membrane protein assembly factor BamA